MMKRAACAFDCPRAGQQRWTRRNGAILWKGLGGGLLTDGHGCASDWGSAIGCLRRTAARRGGRQAWQGLAQAMGFPAVQTASKTAHPFSRKVLPCPHPPRSRAVKRAFHAHRRRCPAWAGASQEPGDRWSRAGDWQPGSSPACLGSVRCERTEFTCFNLTQCSQHTQMHRQMLRSTRRCARYASFELLGQR